MKHFSRSESIILLLLFLVVALAVLGSRTHRLYTQFAIESDVDSPRSIFILRTEIWLWVIHCQFVRCVETLKIRVVSAGRRIKKYAQRSITIAELLLRQLIRLRRKFSQCDNSLNINKSII